MYPFVPLGYPTNRHISERLASLPVFFLSTCAGQPHNLVWPRDVFLELHLSYGVPGTALDGTWFKIYAVVSKAYPQKESGRDK